MCSPEGEFQTTSLTPEILHEAVAKIMDHEASSRDLLRSVEENNRVYAAFRERE